ncbi:hypothetical protein ACWGST_07835 [Agromyces sp. NPDC055520]
MRPEFVGIEADVAAAASDTGNTARGTLIGVSHLGETMQYLVLRRAGDSAADFARTVGGG